MPHVDLAPHETNWDGLLALTLLIVVAVALYTADWGADLIQRRLGPPPDYEELLPAPGEVWVNLLPDTIEIAAKQSYETTFRFDPNQMHSVHLAGSFSLSDASGARITFLLADEKNYGKWKNKLPSAPLYSKTASKDQFDVPIAAAGSYHLVFVNPAGRDQLITCDAKLEYRLNGNK